MIGHTTAHEVQFVRELSSPKTLRAYIKAGAKRTDWGALQPDIILTDAIRRLEEIEKRQGK